MAVPFIIEAISVKGFVSDFHVVAHPVISKTKQTLLSTRFCGKLLKIRTKANRTGDRDQEKVSTLHVDESVS
jgi:hypothetical protein